MAFIEIEHLSHVYHAGEEGEHRALDDVSLAIGRGEFVAVLGSNGSGKSTLAKHLNALLLPTEGVCRVDGIDTREEAAVAEKYRDLLKIKTPSLGQQVKNLSGGNQQKVVLAKSLAAESKILIFDEPTRGIDVGAKQEIYNLMCALANDGIAIIMISSDMEELLGMSDRVIVLCEGRFAGEVPRGEFSQNYILDLASGKH